MKLLKKLGAYLSHEKYEWLWALFFLTGFARHVYRHSVQTSTGWNVTLVGWDAIYAIVLAVAFTYSAITAVNYLRKGRA